MDLKPLSYALELLKIDPCLRNSTLMKLLYNMMPSGFLFSAEFLRNFKLRAAIYHAKYPDIIAIKTSQAKTMLSQYNLKPHEIKSIKDPLKMINFKNLHSNIMNSDVSTWKVLSYL